ncbi:MAG TPA: glycoside hydrolase N-terminal domain-containing protein [Bacteroidales bacterium]|nr:glycoside hydrolase N-terminal domain-containing protein [Bacteroidales bacterium]HQK68396.1 glycoside hydrolase N-terminal domain-containing protein [Bacteroidales bacterium]
MSNIKFSIIVVNLLIFSSLCLGQTSLTYVQPKAKYAPMPISKRADFVPRMGFCSTTPAMRSGDAMYTANGSIKALVYGDPYAERIDFSHESLYVQNFKPLEPPKIAHILPDVRKMLLEGKFREAPNFVMEEVLKNPLYTEQFNKNIIQDTYDRTTLIRPNSTETPLMGANLHSMFNMYINSAPSDNVSDYLRVSDWTTGETRIHWTDERGAHVRRSFVSRPAQAACHLLTAPKGSTLSSTISLDQIAERISSDEVKSLAHENPFLQQFFSLSWSHPLIPPIKYGRRGIEFVNMDTQIKKNEAYMIVKGHYEKAITEAGFVGVVRVVLDGGSIKVEDGALVISGANKATILTTIERLPRYSEEGVKTVRSRIAAVKADYETLLAENAKVLAPQMKSSTVRLCSDYEALKSVEELQVEQISTVELSAPLFEKLYHMGRFFLINETGDLPAAQGQWSTNVNFQVSSGNITGLHEQMEVFFRFFESKFDDFRLNAQNIFGCRGILASIHPNMITGYQYHFSSRRPYQYWIPCAGWVFNQYWGYYLTTADEKFLRDRVVPGLKEIALFFEDYLTDIGPDGRYLFYPGFQAENHENRGPIVINSTMDVMVCREVLTNLLTACATLGISDPKEGKWRDMLSKLPTLLLDETTGSLREFAWSEIPDELQHRYVSHHYDVWPGNAITWEETPEIALAVLKSNRKRGLTATMEVATVQGFMQRLYTAIRLKDSEHAFFILKQLFEHGFVNHSLLTNFYSHRLMWPDAQGAFPSVLAEMAVYSKPGLIELLPAMPDLLAKGEFTGLCLYTFAKLEHLDWDLNENTMSARILPLKDQTITLRIRQGYEKITVDGASQPSQRNEITLNLKKGVPVDIRAELRPKTHFAFK